MRSSRKVVVFTQSFSLGGLDGSLPPGSYAVITDEEQIPGILFDAWRRVQTCIQVPSLESDTGQIQMISINADELAVAAAADRAETSLSSDT